MSINWTSTESLPKNDEQVLCDYGESETPARFEILRYSKKRGWHKDRDTYIAPKFWAYINTVESETVNSGGIRMGASIKTALQFIENVKDTKAAMYIGPDYVAIPKDMYKELLKKAGEHDV